MTIVEVSLIDKTSKSQSFLATLNLAAIPRVGDILTVDNKNETNTLGIFIVEFCIFGDNGLVEIFVSNSNKFSLEDILF